MVIVNKDFHIINWFILYKIKTKKIFQTFRTENDNSAQNKKLTQP